MCCLFFQTKVDDKSEANTLQVLSTILGWLGVERLQQLGRNSLCHYLT